jgi:hypothetical protein
MRYAKLGVVLLLVITSAQLALQAQGAEAIEAASQLQAETWHAYNEVAGGFTFLRDLGRLGTASPTESAQSEHIAAILYWLEGEGGPDVIAEITLIGQVGPGDGTVLTERGSAKIRAGGLLGAIENVKAQLDRFGDLVHQYGDILAAYYESRTGWDGKLEIDAQMAQLDSLWAQITQLGSFILESALAAEDTRESSDMGAELLKIGSYASTAIGYPDRLHRSPAGITIGYIKMDSPSLFRDFFFVFEGLNGDLHAALAATIE